MSVESSLRAAAENRKAINSLLQDTLTGMSRQQVADAVKLNTKCVREHLVALMELGEVARLGGGKEILYCTAKNAEAVEAHRLADLRERERISKRGQNARRLARERAMKAPMQRRNVAPVDLMPSKEKAGYQWPTAKVWTPPQRMVASVWDLAA